MITADANHCTKENSRKIIDNKADYVIQLKGNQGNFYTDVKEIFNDKISSNFKMDKEDYDCYEEYNKNGNRIEIRTCYVLKDVSYFSYIKEWKCLRTIFEIKREIQINGKISKEYSYYISSLTTSPKSYYIILENTG